MSKLAFLLLLLVPALPSSAIAQTAEYEVVFEGIWDASHSFLPFPGGAHFTRLVGDTHTPGEAFWEAGGLATRGVERVAEIGSSSDLSNEVAVRVVGGVSGGWVELGGLAGFPDESSTIVEVAAARSQVSLVSMLAPSPDWFVGVSGLDLRDERGWIAALSVDLTPYDAGTETGNTFSLSNAASDPHGVIAHRGSPFVNDAVVARLHFSLLPEPTGGAGAFIAWILLVGLRRAAGPTRVSRKR